MQIIVSDTSCLVDIRKASLLKAFARMPYNILIPDVLFEEEFLKFSERDKSLLLDNGVYIVEIPAEGVAEAQALYIQNPALTLNDCFAYVVARQHEDSILLTGDSGLRTLAQNSGIEVHGVLWVLDEFYKYELASVKKIYTTLLQFEEDKTVHLPIRALRSRIRKFEDLLE